MHCPFVCALRSRSFVIASMTCYKSNINKISGRNFLRDDDVANPSVDDDVDDKKTKTKITNAQFVIEILFVRRCSSKEMKKRRSLIVARGDTLSLPLFFFLWSLLSMFNKLLTASATIIRNNCDIFLDTFCR